MGASAPSAPGYLQGAIRKVERLLAERYPEPMTAREISDVLRERGYQWPLPRGYFHRSGQTVHRTDDEADPTPERVRRVCEMTGNRTVISHAGRRGRAQAYSVYDWALDRLTGKRATLHRGEQPR